MKISDYQELAMRTSPCLREHTAAMLAHSLCGLASEAGEVADLMKNAFDMNDGDQIEDGFEEHMEKELGDCCWMVAEACTAIDVKFVDIYPNKAVNTLSPVRTAFSSTFELCSLSGWLVGRIQKAYQGHEIDEFLLKTYLGRVLETIDMICRCLGIEFANILEKNIEKLKARFPTGKFDTYADTHRAKGDI